jgi:hypothetical protein
VEVDESNLKVVFKLVFQNALQEPVVAASGLRKSAQGRWKYSSEETFTKAPGNPWGIPVNEFQNASARAGTSGNGSEFKSYPTEK